MSTLRCVVVPLEIVVRALGSIAVAASYDGTVRPMAATVFAAGLVAVVAHWGFGRSAGARA